MSLNDSLNKIKEFLIDRYKDNLAGVLIFGTANTGEFKEGESDIDTIILFKDKSKLNLIEEKEFLLNQFSKENLSILHFRTIENYEEHIYEKGSWASWITVIDGSKKLYTTNDFLEFKEISF